MKALAAVVLTAFSLVGTAQAATYTLDFDEASACAGPCQLSVPISNGHGDVAGVVDVSYLNVNSGSELLWWDADYNDLRGVAWAEGGDLDSHARIELLPASGNAVTLHSMDFGAFNKGTLGTHIVVSAIGSGTSLFSYDGDVGDGAAVHNTFFPNVSSSTGLRIDWYNSAFNVGIDNVNFTVAAVPEPETYLMLLAGLGLICGAVRRRKRRSHT